MTQQKKFPAGIPEGTVLKEITADEIFQLISDQLEFRKLHGNGEKTSFSFEFENILFEDTYVFQKRLKLFSLLFHIFEDIKVWDYINDIRLDFKNCSIESFVIENTRQEPLSISFEGCKVTYLELLQLEKFRELSIDNSEVLRCKIKDNLVFGNVFCKHTLFSKGVDCRNIEFFGSVIFLQCEFVYDTRSSQTDFLNTVFNEKVSFKGSRFNNSVLFTETTFKEFASFEEVIFNRYISFEEVIFNRYISFEKAIFNDSASFEGAEFFVAPEFHNAQLHPSIYFKNCKFRDTSSKRAQSAYRTLKQFMMKNESDHEAQMFHALELESRYNTELPKGWQNILSSPKGVETIFSFCLKQLTNYGRNLWLPFLWLFIFGDLFLIFYAASNRGDCAAIAALPIQGWAKDVCEGGYTNLFYAFKNTFGPFGLAFSDSRLIIPNSVTVKILGFVHILLSSIIWFIWILQIRRRFKL